MRPLWQNITTMKRTGRTPWLSQQQSYLPWLLSTQVIIAEDFYPGPVADAVSPTSQAAALLMVYNVASVVSLIIGSACAEPEYPLDPHPEEQKKATPGTDNIYSDLIAEEKRTNTKARKVRKHTYVKMK